ncbi:MAG: efflux RND transporter periplasmic adaptor subunit [Chitinivibrionales bacterium]|nr:efflux RND transporter periplasmic adaptor subunit [Chitinivibrionales bacterium]
MPDVRGAIQTERGEPGGQLMKTMRIALLGALTLIAACERPESGDKQDEQAAADKATPVEAVVVDRGPLAREVVASGVAAGIREAYVVSQTQGTIQKVAFRLGQYVKEGQLLVQVENAVQKAAYEQAKKQAATATINLDAVQKLYDQGNASEAELTQAQSQATGAQAQLEQARKQYQDTRITAPIAGYIAQTEQAIEEGNALGGGTLVTRVVSLYSLKTTINVGEEEVGLLRPGLPADVRVMAVQGEAFEGKVTAIGAGANPATGSYPVEVVWKNTKDRAVKSGMSVRVRIVTGDPDTVVMIPDRALTEINGRQAVYVARNRRATPRFVELGRALNTLREVTRGLDPGDTLLTSGITTMANGDTLQVTLTGTSVGSL